MTRGSEVMCRQKVDTPWSIYRDFTVPFCISQRASSEYIFYFEFRASIREISRILDYYPVPRKIRYFILINLKILNKAKIENFIFKQIKVIIPILHSSLPKSTT